MHVCEAEILKQMSSEGNSNDALIQINNSNSIPFTMRSVSLTRLSLFHLCGFGHTPREKYLDDQSVNCLLSLYSKMDPAI